MSRFKLIATYFIVILFALSISQIYIDAKKGVSLSIDAPNEKKVYSIFIEIEDKTLYLLENGICIKEYRISSGKSGLPSPLGCWTIIEKGDWGEGFGGSWLGLNVPWGTYRIGTNLRFLKLVSNS